MKAINIEWDIDLGEYKHGIVLLPLEIKIPKGMTNIKEISDYISETTGFCPKGFSVINCFDRIMNVEYTQKRGL